ncbi:mas-related G-protein coupled receptor member F isoform X2 [Prionailurus viverrinus]|uniref:mas-related G-protein coupled receptor member F isoform X2 n=1 Tax=Prionailurus viverrinus TaxID=61388 RepID=UPI001FF15E63|nr:mas-related G-protein coupled receptor member F isoform X2 [Prionailurus viverrinus]
MSTPPPPEPSWLAPSSCSSPSSLKHAQNLRTCCCHMHPGQGTSPPGALECPSWGSNATCSVTGNEDQKRWWPLGWLPPTAGGTPVPPPWAGRKEEPRNGPARREPRAGLSAFSSKGRCAGPRAMSGAVRSLDSPGLEMVGNCSWEAHPGDRNKMCPGVSEAPALYGRGFLTIEQIATPPPPAVMDYIFLLLCLCGLVGNGLVLWFFGFSIKRSPFSVYFLHLAGADAGYLCSKTVLSVLNTGGFLGTFAAYVRAVCRVAGLCMFVAGVSLLPAISSERCLSVVFPAWFWRRRPKRLSAVVCALLWALSLLVTTVHNYFCVFLGHRASGVGCRHMDAFLGILLFLVFCPLMVLPCLVLILHTECRARRRQRSAKLSHVVLAMVSVFLVSSIYLGVDWFLFWVFQIPAPFPEYVTDLCICINSSAKPVVYFLAGRDKSQRLWEPLRVVFQRALRDGAELGEAGGGTPNTVTMEMQCPSGNAS